MKIKTLAGGSKGKIAPSAAESVLNWIQNYIEKNGLKPGDPLPKELEIAKAAGKGRSSVREAITALKALGIVVSRRKGGIRIIREPVLLEIRRYLTESYATKKRYRDAMEFRAVMEWGLGEILFATVSQKTLRSAQAVINDVRDAEGEVDMMNAEWKFHTCLTQGAGNPLTSLLSGLYTPLFDDASFDRFFGGGSEGTSAKWVMKHQALLDALQQRNRAAFLRILKHHTHYYMRSGKVE